MSFPYISVEDGCLLVLLVHLSVMFALIVHMWKSVRRHVHVCCLCVNRLSVFVSVAVLQECVEQSCVGACRSYFGLSCDAAAAF